MTVPQRDSSIAAPAGAHWRHAFWAGWGTLAVLKLVLAAQVPLFVDEGFYWLEGRRLAWAYSDLPGLTAWLVRLGEWLGGTHLLALRAPFLLLGALVPLLVVRIARREYGARSGWQAGTLALLLPLGGTLGLFALPDVPLVLAGLVCVDASAQLLRRVQGAAALQLAAGLLLGGLAHYRFVATVAAGAFALLCSAPGRRALRSPRVWAALAVGALAWLPVLAWNASNAAAGWRFQLLERHPWGFHVDGWQFLPVQALVVTPLLLLALLLATVRNVRAGDDGPRFLALFGASTLLGLFVLGFFADSERISFHWPLTAVLALLPLAAVLLQRWPRALAGAARALAALGLCVVLGYCVALTLPGARALAPEPKWYPSNFAGWEGLAEEVRTRHARMPAATRLVAGDFKVAAQLGFALDDARIPVLPHPLNRAHGRATQLQLWGQLAPGRAALGAVPLLLVIDPASVKPRERAGYAARLCDWAGWLPAAETVAVDAGTRRFVLFALPPHAPGAACVPPALQPP